MAVKEDSLSVYQAKRNFSKTLEPKGKQKKSSLDPIFVVQEHHASHLHWDFRLEIGGVLVSWAIPKGPSLDPHQKRLAVLTEDHPLEYANFEGIIPEGEYGAGTVMVWDYGTYRNLREKDGISMEQSFKDGRITIFLEGKKLNGGFSLVRFKEEKNWLFIKMNDEYANSKKNITETENKSALTGKTIEQIKKGNKNE